MSRQITLTSDIAVRLIQKMGGDHMVVAAAKVSTCGEEAMQFAAIEQAEGNSGLINFLMEHRHGTPFEHSALTFFVRAPIMVWREWHRHRIGFCLAGDSVVDFVDTNGTRAPGICRTIRELYDRWEHGEVNGNATDAGRLAEALALVGRGVSIRTASIKTGIARGTIVRHRDSDRDPGSRGSRWRVDGMRLRVLDEDSQLFGIGSVADVIASGVKELLCLRTESGHQLHCSKDHRIFTVDGWVPAGEIRLGDRVAAVGRRSRFAEKNVPPSLRKGIGVWTSMQRNRLIRPTDRCYICGGQFDRSMLVLDHVVPVVSDLTKALDVSNLKPACESCNRIKTNAEQALAKRGNVAGTKFVKVSANPVVDREDETFDLSVSGTWHNFVANGLVVHNSYNEESARYKPLEPVFWIPRRDRRMAPVDGWKPGRPKFRTLDEAVGRRDTADAWYDRVVARKRRAYGVAYDAYRDDIDDGIAMEVARSVLPVAIYSSCWVTCNPRSLMAFLSLRTHEPDAKFVSYPQAEIEEAARVAESFLAEGWPITYRAFVKHGRFGP